MKTLLLLTLLSLVSCGKHFTKFYEGPDGEQGPAGKDGVVLDDAALITLCPEVAGSYSEAILYFEGDFMAFLSSANYKKQRLVLLEKGVNYSTTDGRNIQFRIEPDKIVYPNNSTCQEYSY